MNEPLIIRCASCGQKNRIRPDRMQDGPVCGRCRKPLPANPPVIGVSDSDFRRVVLESRTPVLVDFWAPWCGPCKMLAPVLERVASEAAGRVLVAKLNVDESNATASSYGVSGVPTLIMFSGGREIDRKVGAVPGPEIHSMIDRAAPR